MKRLHSILIPVVLAVFSIVLTGEDSVADVAKQFNQALKERDFDRAATLVTPESLPIVEAWKKAAAGDGESMRVREKDGLAIVTLPPSATPLSVSQIFLRKADGVWKVDLQGWKHRSDYDKVDPSFTRSSNLKQIGLGLAMYVSDKGDRFPAEDGAAGLDALRKNGYLTDPRVYVSPADSGRKPAAKGAALTEANCSIVYFGGLDVKKLRAPSRMPTAFEKPDAWQDNTLYVLFADGHVEQWKGDYKNVAGLVDAIIKRGGLDREAESLRQKAAEADRRLAQGAK